MVGEILDDVCPSRFSENILSPVDMKVVVSQTNCFPVIYSSGLST